MGSLPAPSNLRTRVEAGIERARRSPAALLLVSAVCGLGLTASAVTLVRAADDAGVLEFIRNDTLNRVVQAVRLPSRVVERPERIRERRPQRAERPRPPRQPAVARRNETPRPRVAAAGPQTPSPQVWSRRTMCVRVCDGYTFPVGVLHGRHDLAAHRTACESACPGAETSLYMLMPGQTLDDPSDARSVQDGSFYRRLKTAFLFKRERIAACSCQGPDNIARATPILLDPTLRSGDVVIDQEGSAKVFAGPGGIPHSPRAFTDYRRSRALSRTAQAEVDRLMGTSQRAALAREYARQLKIRQAALTELPAPAGSASGVRVYQVRSDAGSLDPSGARIIAVR